MIWNVVRTLFSSGPLVRHGKPGRFDNVGILWAAQVSAALDKARAFELMAVVVGTHDPKAAARMLDHAETIRSTGKIDGSVAGLPSREESIKEWERMHGGSMDDPEVRERIYKAVADMRKLDLEKSETDARNRAKAASAAAKLRRKDRPRPR